MLERREWAGKNYWKTALKIVANPNWDKVEDKEQGIFYLEKQLDTSLKAA